MPAASAQPAAVINALTVARLLLLVALIASIIGRPGTAWAWVAALVVADIFDGVLARKLGCDTKVRRSLDAVVDRVCIHTSFAVAVAIHHEFFWVYIPLLVRDVGALSASGLLLRHRHLLLLGGHWHKLASLSCAAFGLAILTLPWSAAIVLGVVAVTVNYVLLLDYAGGYLVVAGAQMHPDRFHIVRLVGCRYIARRAFRWRTAPSCVASDGVLVDVDRRPVVALSAR